MATTYKSVDLISSDEVEISPQLNDIFPNGKNSIIKKGIQAITYNKFLRFCQAHNLNINLFVNVEFFEVSKDMEMKLRQIYRLIKQDTYYTNQDFSFVDFLLVCVAFFYNIPVVSFDKHLTQHLQKYMTYNALWPTDVIRSTFNTSILIDTNIIYSIVTKNSEQLQNILQMIQLKNQNYMIPDLIIDELSNLLIKEQKNQRYPKKNSRKSKNLNDFIDDNDSKPKYRTKKKFHLNNYSDNH